MKILFVNSQVTTQCVAYLLCFVIRDGRFAWNSLILDPLRVDHIRIKLFLIGKSMLSRHELKRTSIGNKYLSVGSHVIAES